MIRDTDFKKIVTRETLDSDYNKKNFSKVEPKKYIRFKTNTGLDNILYDKGLYNLRFETDDLYIDIKSESIEDIIHYHNRFLEVYGYIGKQYDGITKIQEIKIDPIELTKEIILKDKLKDYPDVYTEWISRNKIPITCKEKNGNHFYKLNGIPGLSYSVNDNKTFQQKYQAMEFYNEYLKIFNYLLENNNFVFIPIYIIQQQKMKDLGNKILHIGKIFIERENNLNFIFHKDKNSKQEVEIINGKKWYF